LTGADMGNIQLFDSSHEHLVIKAHRGFKQPFLKFFAVVKDQAASCGQAMETGTRVIVPDIETSAIFSGTSSLQMLLDAGVRAVQSTPLISSAGHLLGVMSTHYRRSGQPSPRQLRQLDLLARMAADFLERQHVQLDLQNSEAHYRALVSILADVP